MGTYGQGGTPITGSPPACRATGTSTSIPNDVETYVPLAAEDYDTDTMHDTVTSNTRVTIKTAGLYAIVANVSFPTNGIGYRWSAIRLNGTTYLAEDSKTGATTATNVGHSLAVMRRFAVNDYVELGVRQTTGGALSLSVTPVAALCATWLGLGT